MLSGGPALADFRLRALTDAVNECAEGPKAARIEASFVFFVECADEPGAEVRAKVHALLGTAAALASADGFFVTPRKGTISPWSSKATDIFRNCGLEALRRVERGVHYRVLDAGGRVLGMADLRPALGRLHDRMTEGVYEDVSDMFAHRAPAPFVTVDALAGGIEALREANRSMGLALSEDEMAYLLDATRASGRNPTDVELVMFGQVNSEHCRHKIFNARWLIDGVPMPDTLFGMIRNTHARHPQGTLVAYKDNSGVIEGFEDAWFEVTRDGSNRYAFSKGRIDILLKVETHNHPTAISPYPGAATGVGGEIRDRKSVV